MKAINIKTGEVHEVKSDYIKGKNGDSICKVGSVHAHGNFLVFKDKLFESIKSSILRYTMRKDKVFPMEPSYEVDVEELEKKLTSQIEQYMATLKEQSEKNISCTFKNLDEKRSNTIGSIEEELENIKEKVRNMDNEYKRKFGLLDNKIDEGKSHGVNPQTLTDAIRRNVKGVLELGYEIEVILVSESGERQLALEQQRRTTERYVIMFNADIEIAEPDETWPHGDFKVVIK